MIFTKLSGGYLPQKKYGTKYGIQFGEYMFLIKKVEDKWIQINVNKSGGVWQRPVIPGTYQDECPILTKRKK